jgi:hypothetical protein
VTLGQKFMALFSGLDRAHGLGVGRIEKTPPTEALFKWHLAGEGSGLGVFPLRDDGTVLFAAIDLDEPNFELAATLQSLLPGRSWLERSRSGNAHVWVFFEEPCPAWVARGILKFALEAVGRNDVEVFPKQDRLMEGMVGNYINLPLHGQDRPIIKAPEHDGATGYVYTRNEWINEAYETRNDPEEWKARALALGITPPEERAAHRAQGELGFLHDCAAHIIKHREDNPVVEGHRSVVYFNLAKQLLNYKEMSEEEARMFLHEVNEAAQPPAPEREVDRIFNNAMKGGFTGTGCDDPLMAPYVLPDCPIARGNR